MASYTTKALVENYLLIDIDPSFDTQIEAWATVVTNFINNYTGNSWNTATGVRYFDTHGGTEISIDNFTTLTTVQTLDTDGVTVDKTLVEGTDFITYPYNTLPKYKLILLRNSTIGRFPNIGIKRLKVDATWGQADIPEDIKLAATILLGGIIEKGLKGGVVQSESLGDYSVSFSSVDSMAKNNMEVSEILDSYKVWTL